MDSKKMVSRFAGVLNLLIAVCAPFSIIFIPSKLIVLDNADVTASNIRNSEQLFRTGIASSIVVHILQILFVLLLYKLLKKHGKNTALLMLVFSLIGVSIALNNEINQIAVLQILKSSADFNIIDISQVSSQVMFFLNLHSQGILLAQIFWGLWLFPLGFLIVKSGEVPKLIGFLLIIAGLGYLTDSFGKLIFTNYNITISMFTFIGEVIFIFWLIVKGISDCENGEKN